MDYFLHVVVQASLVILVPILVGAAVQLLRRINIQLSEVQQAALDKVIRRAILEAEEWGAARLKAKLPVTSHQKLERASNVITTTTKLSVADAEMRIRAMLPETHAGAAAHIPATPT